jgi:hypothetical protein
MHPREITQVPMIPTAIGNLEGATKWNNSVLPKKTTTTYKERIKKSSE